MILSNNCFKKEMIDSFVRYDHYIEVMLKRSSFLLGLQTEIFTVEMIIYLVLALKHSGKIKQFRK